MRIPTFRLIYLDTDITSNIRDLCESIAYTDSLEDRSDEIEITLDNSDLRWMNTWLPSQGDRISLQIGYENEALFPAVTFEIDELEFAGVPDTVRIKGVATPITSSLRQRNTAAYENTTLRAIARQIAEKHGLTLVGGELLPNTKIERMTQRTVTDLEFLRDAAKDYGLIFKIESSTRLVFYKESALENADAVLTIARTDIKGYSLRRGAQGTHKGASIRYYDPKSGKEISVKVDAEGNTLPADENVASGSLLQIRERCETLEQARLKATEALRKANKGAIEFQLQALEGNVRLSAGINITLDGFGSFSGKYQLASVRHQFTKSQGYTCDVESKGIEVTATGQ